MCDRFDNICYKSFPECIWQLKESICHAQLLISAIHPKHCMVIFTSRASKFFSFISLLLPSGLFSWLSATEDSVCSVEKSCCNCWRWNIWQWGEKVLSFLAVLSCFLGWQLPWFHFLRCVFLPTVYAAVSLIMGRMHVCPLGESTCILVIPECEIHACFQIPYYILQDINLWGEPLANFAHAVSSMTKIRSFRW